MAGPKKAVKRKSTALNTSSAKKLKLVPSSSSFEFSDMNEDCLIHVFKSFDIITLSKMARTCKRFHSLITTHIVPFRAIDFSTFRKRSSVRRIFELFGKSMTHIVVHQDDIQTVFPGYTRFAEFLRLLVEFGQPGKLKHVSLTFGGWHCHVPGKLLQDATPYFTNVRLMEFNFTKEQMHQQHFTPFLVAIDKQNLRELRLHNVAHIGEWFTPEMFANVQKIHLCLYRHGRNFFWNQQFNHDRDAFNENRLMHFLARKPAPLIDFECIEATSDGIFVELSRRNPGIERLGEIQYWPNDAAAADNNNNNVMNGFHGKWQYFKAFTNLKDLSMKSSTANFSDSGEAFKILAKHQTIEQLQLSLGWTEGDQGNPVQAADLKRLIRLKTLNLLNLDDNRSKDFVTALFANLPALTTVSISGKHPVQGRVIELIKSAPKLKVLKFNCKFSSFSVPFYKKLVKCRAPPDGEEARNENHLVIYIERDSAQKCIEKLGNRRYKPNIILLKSI